MDYQLKKKVFLTRTINSIIAYFKVDVSQKVIRTQIKFKGYPKIQW